MNLNYKTLILISLTWVAYFVVSELPGIRHSFISHIILLALFISLTLLFLQNLFIQRIKKINREMKVINSSDEFDVFQSMHVKGNDEIASIAKEINFLLERIKESRDLLSNQIEDRMQTLQKANIQLQNEILERKAIERDLVNHREGLTQLAQYDNLTSLPNRIFFNEILNKTLNHAKRRNKILAILSLNLDKFKNINNNYGHTVGDYTIKEISSRIAKTLRTEDILARLEGDEFFILLNDIGKPKFASTVAEKLLKICAQPIKINSHEISLTTSIGICIYPNDGTSLEDLLKNVSTALYKAKRDGGNLYQFYTHEMTIEAREYIKLDAALKNAITQNQLLLYFQPKLHIRRGNIVSVEALLRWSHPELGLIYPASFIPLAEESGLYMQLCEWTLREACKINKYWQDEGYEHMTVGINLSAKQFYHPDIAKLIADVLKETGLNSKYLEIEITENIVMDDIDQASTILEKIRTTGVQLTVDHFGTGYTSISHLKLLPISAIKIDKNFIKGIPYTPNDMAITNAFIALGHNLGLEVIAEGVETAEQVQYLANQNCDMVQGYYLSHPLPAQKIVLQFKKLMDEVLI